MSTNKKIKYNLEYFLPNIDRQKFFDLFVNHQAWTESEFLPNITILKPGKTHPQGEGALRLVESGRMKIKEDITGFKSPEYFTYATRNGSMPVNDFGGELVLEERKGGVLAKYEGGFNPKYFGTGRILRIIFRRAQIGAFKSLEKAYKDYYLVNK